MGLPIITTCSVLFFAIYSRQQILPLFYMNRNFVPDGAATKPKFDASKYQHHVRSLSISKDLSITSSSSSCVVHGIGIVPYSSVKCAVNETVSSPTVLTNATVITRKLPSLSGNFTDVLMRKLFLLKLVRGSHNPFVVYVGTEGMQEEYRKRLFRRKLHTLLSRAVAPHSAVINVGGGSEGPALCLGGENSKLIDSDEVEATNSGGSSAFSDSEFLTLREELRTRVLELALHRRRTPHRSNANTNNLDEDEGHTRRSRLFVRILTNDIAIQKIAVSEMARVNLTAHHAVRMVLPDPNRIQSPRMYINRLAEAKFVLMPGTLSYLLSAAVSLAKESVVLLLSPAEDEDSLALLTRSVKYVGTVGKNATEQDIRWALQDCIGTYMQGATN